VDGCDYFRQEKGKRGAARHHLALPVIGPGRKGKRKVKTLSGPPSAEQRKKREGGGEGGKTSRFLIFMITPTRGKKKGSDIRLERLAGVVSERKEEEEAWRA